MAREPIADPNAKSRREPVAASPQRHPVLVSLNGGRPKRQPVAPPSAIEQWNADDEEAHVEMPTAEEIEKKTEQMRRWDDPNTPVSESHPHLLKGLGNTEARFDALDRANALIVTSGLPLNLDEREPVMDITIDAVQTREKGRTLLSALRLWGGDPRDVLPTLYSQGDMLVRLKPDCLSTQPLGVHELTHVAARAADWFRLTEKGSVPTVPPMEYINDVLATLKTDFPPLDAFRTVPYFDHDGTLVTQRGYNLSTRILLNYSDALNVQVPSNPTAAQIKAAVNAFRHLFAQFPFDGAPEATATSAPSFANTMGLLLTPLVRDLIPEDSTPLFAVDATAPGSGKGLLVKVIGGLITGKRGDMPASILAETPEEIRKAILAELLQGSQFIFYDNVNHLVDSAALSSALTENPVRGRILGVTRTVSVPNRATWIMTGNALRFSREMARRVVPILLDPKMEHPDERTGFALRLPEIIYDPATRSTLISAALTLIRHWVCEQRPDGSEAMGSFEPWSRMIGGILGCAEIHGFLTNRATFRRSNDAESQEQRAFIECWADQHADHYVRPGQLVADAKELMPSLMRKAATVDAANSILGLWLNRKERTVIAGYRVERKTNACAVNNKRRDGWRVVPV